MSIEKKDEEALREFLADIECLDALSPWIERFNIFDILKISRTEIRHINMLSWLLDPNENHGLGDKFLKNMFLKILKENEDKEYDSFKLLLMDLYSFRVFREREHIDILLVSDKEKYVIAIENKIGSSEHNHQLERYHDYLKEEYENYKKILVFLTPDGDKPSDNEWGILSYENILDTLDKVYNNCKLQPDADLLLKNYIEVVRRDIVEDQLLEVCNDIYNRHAKALDLIFKFKSSERSNVTKWISETLESLSNSNKEVVYNNKGKGFSIKFRLKTIDDILMGAFPHDNITEIYFFAFKFKRGKKEIRIRWHKTKNIDSNIIKEIAYSLTQTDRDSDIKAVTNWKEYTDSKENIEKIVKESIDELLHKINILKGKNHGK